MKLKEHEGKSLQQHPWIIIVLIIAIISNVGTYASSSTSVLRGVKTHSSSKSTNGIIRTESNSIISNGRRFGLSRPCRFFLWDGISAIKYYTCRHLMRDRIYEGLGGKKFIRIKPGSILECLYPLSNHSPDRCSLCGLSFDKHLATWWFPQLYSPFDIHLDRVFQRATMNETPCSPSLNQKRKHGLPPTSSRTHVKQKFRKRKNTDIDDINFKQEEKELDMKPLLNGLQKSSKPFPVLNYHKAYIKLLNEQAIDFTSSERQQQQKSGLDSQRKLRSKNKKIEDPPKKKYCRTTIHGLKYNVPNIQTPKNYKDMKGYGILLFISREIVLEQLDSLLSLEQRENWFHERKQFQGH